MSQHAGLIVDDDAMLADALKTMLKSVGHQAETAHTQAEALALLERQPFCYALIDLELPAEAGVPPDIETGFALLELLNKRWGETKPVLVMTGHGDDHHHCRRAFLGGAINFIKKPFRGEERPEQIVRQAVADSCERRHPAGCPNVGERLGGGRKLYLIGEQRRRAFLVEAGGAAVYLPLQAFELLAHLVAARLGSGQQHVEVREVVGAHYHKAVSRLRSRLEDALGPPEEWLIPSGQGEWRLAIEPEQLGYDPQAMQAHGELIELLEASKRP